jgi:hypothetical protein
MLENLIFLSYRRADTAPFTLALKLELEDQLRAAQVFVDAHHIQGADRWAKEIETALRTAKVVLPVIGRAGQALSYGVGVGSMIPKTGYARA